MTAGGRGAKDIIIPYLGCSLQISISVPGFVNHNSCNWSVAILKVIAVFIVFVAASG